MEEIDAKDLEAALRRIRAQAEAENIRLTQHAHQQMVEEDITLDEVLGAVAEGEILENYPTHRRGPCCLLKGLTRGDRPLHVVCTTAQPVLIIITVRLRRTTPLADTDSKRTRMMQCTIRDCPGEYQKRQIAHIVRHQGQVMVIDHVPAEVCSVCGDVLLKPETVRRIEALVREAPSPSGTVPLYEYA